MPKKWALDDRAQLHKDANALLDQNLAQGEPVRVILRGRYDQAMIGTDRRVFVFKKGMMSGAAFGKKLSSYEYRHITGIQIETGILTGVVALAGPGIQAGDMSSWGSGKGDPDKMPHAMGINSVEFAQAREGVARLRELISAAQMPQSMSASASAPDPMDQLRKLGELRDAGILTPAEFEAKKAELLARL